MFAEGRYDSSWLSPDLASFKRQASIFILLNLFLLAFLLCLHQMFASYWGNPSQTLVSCLAGGFALKTVELIWIRGLRRPLTPVAIQLRTWVSITLNLSLALILAALTDHDDTPYSVLMLVPILETAFRARLLIMLGVVTIADYLNFFWIWLYFRRHQPVDVGEYFEAGITSLMFLVVGLVVWMLANHLRRNEAHLARNLAELEKARERLLHEERLAAVGRLSSAIAHEIRNPVAMISSSLATATQEGFDAAQREQMFDIAAKEAGRLERLTTDFLSYAKPRPPQTTPISVADTLGYVASVCRAHAGQKEIELLVSVPDDLVAEADPGQVQQALLNLVMNAVDASPAGGVVALRASRNGDRGLHIDIANGGAAIAGDALSRIFEPFFTTKSSGTGLGLAIARNIARAHGGDLVLARNEPQEVCFSMILPLSRPAQRTKGTDGPNPDRR